MTLEEYKNACTAASYTEAFLNKTVLQNLNASLFTNLLISQVEAVVPVQKGSLEILETLERDDLTDQRTVILNFTTAFIIPKMEEWVVKNKAIQALVGVNSSDLSVNFFRSMTGNGRKDGGTETDGTASRNSFDDDELVPVSGSHVKATSGEMYSDTKTESGYNGKSKAEMLQDLIRSPEWNDIIMDMVQTVTEAIAVATY